MFTPVESAIGALLIQAATSSYMRIEGKGIGFSSILYNTIFKPSVHPFSIMVGLFLSSKFVNNFLPKFASNVISIFSKGTSSFYGSTYGFLISGLLVGLGTSAGCGCTSGHMVVGISRLRWRSFIATSVFFLSAVITTIATGSYRHVNTETTIPNYYYDSNFEIFRDNMKPLLVLLLISELWSYVVLPKFSLWLKSKDNDKTNNTYEKTADFIVGSSSGFLFGCGLFISGMTDPKKVTGFLSFLTPNNFDPSLAMVVLFTIVPNIILWQQWLPKNKIEANMSTSKDIKKKDNKIKKPVLKDHYDLNFNDNITTKFILGNIIFGIGWGISGVCPGPAILTAFSELNMATLGRGVLFILGFEMGSFFEKHANIN